MLIQRAFARQFILTNVLLARNGQAHLHAAFLLDSFLGPGLTWCDFGKRMLIKQQLRVLVVAIVEVKVTVIVVAAAAMLVVVFQDESG